MMTARLFKPFFILIILAPAVLIFPQKVKAAAGSPQTCTKNTTCTIGEFLYDDNYSLITDAECKISSRYPDGTVYLEEGTGMTRTDGWYSYQFTAPAITGYYRTQVCCTSGTDYLCLDKSFEVNSPSTSASPSEIASAVWGYSDRTMSGFGTLASDIWNNSSRTLSSFSALVSDIWNNSSRTLTGTQVTNITNNMAANLTTIEKNTRESRLLLIELVNKPIIQNSLEEVPDLRSKIDETKSTADQLYINSQDVVTEVSLVSLKWKTLDEKELLNSLLEADKVLGQESDSESANTVFGQLNWLKKNWDWPLVSDIFSQAQTAKKSLTAIQNPLESIGKTSKIALHEVNSMTLSLKKLEILIGDSASSNISDKKTLFAKIKETEELAEAWGLQEAEVDKLLASWQPQDQEKQKDTRNKTDELVKKIISVNQIPKAAVVLSSYEKNDKNSPLEKKLKNKLLGMRALINANRILIVKGTNKSFSSTWLEEGSIVFKSLATNPSNLISQKAKVKYYLPPEVTKEDILEVDEGLSVNYDTEKNQFYVEGEVELAPGETRTVSVKLNDLWTISEDEVATLRRQAEDLSRPLEKTAYFAQGVTLKSDIDVSLDKVLVLAKNNKTTPEQKIKAYREAKIELDAAKVKIEKLKELVTQASSSGAFFGFVGGSQALAVWGLIIILLAGFVFLALYMKTISRNLAENQNHQNGAGKSQPDEGIVAPPCRRSKMIQAVLIFLAFGATSALFSGIITSRVVFASLKPVKQAASPSNVVLGAIASPQQSNCVLQPSPVPTPLPQKEVQVKEEKTVTKIIVPPGDKVNIREAANLGARIVVQLTDSIEVKKLEQADGWIKVVFTLKENDPDSLVEGWVSVKFVNETSELD